MMVC